MTTTFKPKKKVWTPPSKSEHQEKVQKIKKGGSFSSLSKYVGKDAKPAGQRSRKPQGSALERYVQGKTRNPLFSWHGKDGHILVSGMDINHLVGSIGYLYWVDKSQDWLCGTDPNQEYVQRDRTYLGSWVREAFDALLTEAMARPSDLTKEHKVRLNKIVKHVLVKRVKEKRKQERLQERNG